MILKKINILQALLFLPKKICTRPPHDQKNIHAFTFSEQKKKNIYTKEKSCILWMLLGSITSRCSRKEPAVLHSRGGDRRHERAAEIEPRML